MRIPCLHHPQQALRGDKLRSDILKTEILICHRIRYLCKECGKTFVLPLRGAMVGRSLTYQERAAIIAELNAGDTFARCLENVGFVATRLENCRNEILAKVAATYRKWEVPIARGLAKNEFGWVFTNAKMEAGNDVAQTMIDAAYGYRNFERFRKRFLLMRWNKKK